MAEFTVTLDPRAAKELADLPVKIQGQMTRRLETLQAGPMPSGAKRLQGTVGPYRETGYRVRSGDYRAIYVVRGQSIVVLSVGHRREVYR